MAHVPSTEGRADLGVIAIVVTRNRSALLKECLEGLARQTVALADVLVIDNASTDDTERVVQEAPCKPWYIRLGQNMGSSMGFHEGMRLASEKSYNWFWLMDDDLVPEADCLERLATSPHFAEPETGMLAAVVRTPEGKLEERSCSRLVDVRSFRTVKVYDGPRNGGQVELINCSTFLGLLINRRAVERVGLPVKEFFISCDDVEYCLRVSKSGLKGYLVWDAAAVHFSPNVKRLKKWFLPGYTHIPRNNLWKVYCGYRNRAYVIAQHSTRRALLREFCRLFAAVLFYDDDKFRRWGLLCKGFWHGYTGRLRSEDVKSLLTA
jgi:rhamnopyranosyl-N-acetylglucosaminyl-diphospho-decaprenol beta-1,3/1,4-galactofuranosyltransferase